MVKWTPKSEADLDDLREYIAGNFDVELAIKIANDLVDYTDSLLCKNPLAGQLFEQNPLFSRIVYQGNSIYYCENPYDKDLYIIYVQCRGMQLKNKRLNDTTFSS
ncbi:MAG: type II toxin-antitoxin system RelE/ParE family toxin [Gammaproteobacteria bacterium]|nr:type II toxin-antitoxin system RelE/ParE family toxin [Gammaproteobacteria bacterium]